MAISCIGRQGALAAGNLEGRSQWSVAMVPEQPQRPAWLNWLILAAFLWSSWQLAGMWFNRLHG
ncbi:MAG TPA: hypothetical protein DDY43_13775 [Synechococcales bacterium UBA10510]|nr:hypothetical protein [Synechococcales bacterium UBA10510]